MKKIITAVLLWILLSTKAFAALPASTLAERKALPMAPLPLLSVQDGALMAGQEEVLLKGVNLGGWLLTETWMSPILDPGEQLAHEDIEEILVQRFGEEKKEALFSLYRKSFITEADFARMHRWGMNCVRIPFWYGLFMDEKGHFHTENPEESPGFQALDFALSMCDKYGLWAILDMHGCPGGQSSNQSTGQLGRADLYTEPVYQEAMECLWTAIATRYKDRTCVGAYDIMNEPMNNQNAPHLWQAESREAVARTQFLYAWMAQAIRRVDPDHILSLEGVWTTDTLPSPQALGCDNLLYQLHLYDTEKDMLDLRIEELVKVRDQWGVAVLVGEYNSFHHQAYATAQFQKNNISYLKWTYKTIGQDNNWGLFNKTMKKVNLKTASYEEIKKAFSADMHTERGFVLNQEELQLIQ